MRISTLAVATAAAVAITLSSAAQSVDNAAGFWVDGIFNVSPFIDLSYARDDNPNSLRRYSKERARENGLSRQLEDADIFILKGGINFLMPGNHWRLDGRAFYNHEEASGADVDDRDDIYERFTLKGWSDAGTTWYLTEGYQDIRYDDEFELSKDDRSLWTLGAGGDMAVSDKSKIVLGVGYDYHDYDEESHYDYYDIKGSLGFAHVLTEKTDWTATASYRYYDRDDYDSNAYAVNGMLGLRSRTTDKLTFDTAFGVEYYRDYKYNLYDLDGNVIGRQSKGKDGSSFVYRIHGSWKIDKRLTFNLSAFSEYGPSDDVADNSILENTVSAVLNYKPGDHWSISAGASYERDDYTRKYPPEVKNGSLTAPVEEGGKDRKDDEFRYFANVSYALTRFCSIYVNWRYTDMSSSIDKFDYDRTRYGGGILLRY